MDRCYKLAWECALICIEKGYSKQIWISPIPQEYKDALWDKAEKYLKRKKVLEREPLLFNGGLNE